MRDLVKMLNTIENVVAIPNFTSDVVHLYDCEGIHDQEIEDIIYDHVCYEYTKEDENGLELYERWYYKGLELLWYKKAGKGLFEKILINFYKSLSVADLYDVLVHVEQPQRSKNVNINATCKIYQLNKQAFFELFSECIKLQSNTKNDDKKEYALKLRISDKKVSQLFTDTTLKCTMNEPLEKWLHLATHLQQKYNLTNRGQAFEFMQNALYGISPYKIDNIGFWIEGDYTTKQGYKVQCKAPKATIASIETLKKIIDTMK